MSAWARFYLGVLVAGAFSTFTLIIGTVSAAVVAVGVPLVVGLVGTLVVAFLERRKESIREAPA